MLEWYRAGESYQTLWSDCAAILRIASETQRASAVELSRQILRSDRRVSSSSTLNQAFEQLAQYGLPETTSTDGVDRDRLAEPATDAGIRIGDDDTWADIFSRVLVEKIEPNLGSAALRCFMNTRPTKPHSHAPRRATQPSPNASSFMPAASNSPTASAN